MKGKWQRPKGKGRQEGTKLAAFVTCALVVASPAWAQTPGASAPDDADRPLVVRWSLKGTGVVSRPSRAALLRARIEPTWRLGTRLTFEAAYEQRLRAHWSDGGSVAESLGVLPADVPPAFRLTPLDWAIASNSRATWRHEIDRAVLHATLPRVDVSVGRQAVGWGRGVLFGAVDLFAPFSPFEADREWRRGIDAVRLDARLSDRTSADIVLAFGRRPDTSAYAARWRGFAGNVDLEVVGGRRARDAFAGAASSFVIGPAEMHVEVAAFRTPGVPGSAIFERSRTIVKAVAGGSSRVPVGGGILVHVEYHYSGFGALSGLEILPSLADPEFVARLVRADTQILTRHALAIVASYEWSPLVALSAAVVQEPTDGSGIVAPSLTITFNDRWSLLASAYVAYGRGSTDSAPRSAYGSAASTGLVQLRFYR